VYNSPRPGVGLADVVGLCRHNLHIEVQHFLRTRMAKNDMAIPFQNITTNIRGTRNKLFPAKTFQFARLQRNTEVVNSLTKSAFRTATISGRPIWRR